MISKFNLKKSEIIKIEIKKVDNKIEKEWDKKE